MSILWEHETPVRDFGIDVPAWIDQDIHATTVAAIVQGGCESGAYMPAVTYHKARETMSEYGDDVLTFLEDSLGELPALPESPSWSGIAVHFLSSAVDLWASSIESELESAIEDADE